MSVFAIYSVPIAAGLAYLPYVAKAVILHRNNAYDNKNPRASQIADPLKAETSALCTRLGNAHNNQLETLGLYAAGIAAGTAVGVPPTTMTKIARMYVGSRTAYVAAYTAPQYLDGNIRSVTWTASLAAALWTFFAAANRLKK